jgi:hypothetical protein
MASGGAPRFAS